MWYPAVVETSPASEPITLAQVKTQCSIASADSSRDGIIALLIPAARQAVQNYCGIRLVLQEIGIHCDCFGDFGRVPEAPVKAVSAVTYVDPAGAPQTLADTVYEVRNEGLAPSIMLKSGQRWPSLQPGSRIKVAATCGYDVVPADIVSGLLLTVTKLLSLSRDDMMKRREVVEGIGETQWGGIVETTGVIDATIAALLEPYRNWPLA